MTWFSHNPCPSGLCAPNLNVEALGPAPALVCLSARLGTHLTTGPSDSRGPSGA